MCGTTQKTYHQNCGICHAVFPELLSFTCGCKYFGGDLADIARRCPLETATGRLRNLRNTLQPVV